MVVYNYNPSRRFVSSRPDPVSKKKKKPKNPKKQKKTQAQVAHVCNPSYSRRRDQKDCSLKPAWANSSRDPISIKNPQITGRWSGSRCRP
jgi:hypothetical protein